MVDLFNTFLNEFYYRILYCEKVLLITSFSKLARVRLIIILNKSLKILIFNYFKIKILIYVLSKFKL